MILSPSAQKVQDLLTLQGFDCKVIEFAESTRTAQEAADRAGCLLGQIIKSLIFKGKTSHKPILGFDQRRKPRRRETHQRICR